MNVRRVLGIIALVFIVIVAAIASGLFLYSQYLYRDSYGSEYTYDVRISPSAPITNTTFLVPLPANDGPVNASMVHHPFTPDGWSYDVVETESGPMLRIQADEIPTDPTYHYSVVRDNRLIRWETISEEEYDPDNSSHVRATHEDIDIQTSVATDQTIDTQSPINSEPLLRPHENLTDTACFMADDDEGRCYTYDGHVFASYDATPDTVVYVSVRLRGANSWWVFGWNFNEYVDHQSVEIIGSNEDWVATQGELRTGNGNYRPPPN